MRIYRCDNCGEELETEDEVRYLKWLVNEVGDIHHIIGEYCAPCMNKIEARIKEGVN